MLGGKSYSFLISRIFQRVLSSRTTASTSLDKVLVICPEGQEGWRSNSHGRNACVYEAVLSTHVAAPVLATLSPSSPRGRNNDQDSQAVFSDTQLTPARGGQQRPGSPSFGREEKACLCSLLLMVASVKTLLKYLVCLSILYPLGSFQSSKWSKMSSLSSLIFAVRHTI